MDYGDHSITLGHHRFCLPPIKTSPRLCCPSTFVTNNLMTEILAIPKWKENPRPLDDWLAAFSDLGSAPTLNRDGAEAVWIELGPLRTRGYALAEAGLVTAIHFEIHAPDPSEARAALDAAAESLGWELHDDTDDEDDD